jgi:DNA-binding NarL/FixJ family response regulator
MKRLDGPRRGELFWCHVTGRALDPAQPHAAGIWAFEDLSSSASADRGLHGTRTRDRRLLIDGLTSKLIGKRLGISPRTVDVYRARLMRKVGAATTPDLVHKLLAG